MNPGLFLLVLLGGGIGASLRFVIDGLIMSRALKGGYPLGTLIINLTGSFLLGFLTGAALSDVVASPWLAVLGGGVMGGYTTFSTAMVDTVHLLQKRKIRAAIINGGGMIVAAVLLSLIGLAVGRAL